MATAARLTKVLTDLFPRREQRPDVLARHPRDVGDGNLLRADRLAFAFVRAAPEPFRVGLFDHRDNARAALDLTLRKQRQMRDLRAHEQVSRRVLAGGDARAAA